MGQGQSDRRYGSYIEMTNSNIFVSAIRSTAHGGLTGMAMSRRLEGESLFVWED